MKAVETQFDARMIETKDFDHFISQVIDRNISVITRTKPVRPIAMAVRVLKRTPCQWHGSLWARTIRKMSCSKWLSWMVPYPIEQLAMAQEVEMFPERIEISEEVLTEVRLQITAIHMEGRQPEKIVLGHESWQQVIEKGLDFGRFPYSPDNTLYGTLFGVPMIVTTRLEKGAVLVV